MNVFNEGLFCWFQNSDASLADSFNHIQGP